MTLKKTTTCDIRKGFATSTSSLLADLILAFNNLKIEIDLRSSDFFLRLPQTGLRGHTYSILQGSSRFRRRSGAGSVHVVK